ncbi:photosystem II assembly protein Psb34 [Leptothoe sp. PORK10 BA2]|uniref:photosystem II assembly protein Psb34 n=1 Tax=Leptothoe sp. PORK10 BA2 TaxID=3110254 RepID=UPI002B1F6C2B|nr:ssl1498 family light-harvesting-like protein [Leptothoe sp. PORK10 BA2]MEA5464824.1 ssl1498 family light-harvesting-like protein [Leptothoe sp. PORK10 BA2]
MRYINKEKKISDHSPSDGSELTPAEAPTTRHKSQNEPLGAGYRVNDEGIVNNYALEPEVYETKYPSPKQQRRYIVLGGAAILFVALVVWIAFAVS